MQNLTRDSRAVLYSKAPKSGIDQLFGEGVVHFFGHFIIDCSGFTFVDSPVRDLFEKCGFFRYVQKHNFYPTIRDAVAIARKRRNASTQHLLDEPTERQYDAMETAMERQPMS
ncbi:hypothetical protein niasHT_024580 [Heterodera trifolii]|uniref:STAS domain-containing protein n=1 Tax=Heterodera trifolii TaxID=157864 RepID=A0ABD2K7G9_9BILA